MAEQLVLPLDLDSLELQPGSHLRPRILARKFGDGEWPAGFDYGRCPRVFGSHAGRGPLVLCWDTNILIDYQQFREALWNEDELPDVDDKYRHELGAIRTLVTGLFPFRDVLLLVGDVHMEDHGSGLSPSRRNRRRYTISKLNAALELSVDAHDAGSAQRTVLPAGAGGAQLDRLPPGQDRALVAAAIDGGCHAFITRDDGILGRSADLWPQIAPVRPTDLVDALREAGELSFATSSVLLGAPFPDLGRVAMVIEAIGAS